MELTSETNDSSFLRFQQKKAASRYFHFGQFYEGLSTTLLKTYAHLRRGCLNTLLLDRENGSSQR